MSNVTKQNLEVLKKVFAALTMTATVLSLAGVAAFVPTGVSAVAPSDYGLKEGDVVSAAGSDDPDVYIINELGYKRLFLNPAIFGFYGHLGGFAAVKNVSPATRDAFGTSGLFRNCESGDEKVYGVESTGEDTAMLHWVNTTGSQAVVDDPNFFKKVFCINNNEFNWYSKGSDYTSVNQVPNYSRTPGQSTGPISVSLASDNPVAGTIVDTQARYALAKFMFSGSSTVTSVKLKRLGVSADASLTNVYLYDGTKRLTDSANVSDGVISFNDTAGLFSVSGSKVVSVLADVDGTSGETVGVQLTEVNGSAVNVSGNLHTIATATLATVAVNATTTPTTDGAPTPQDDFVAWQNSITVGQRYVWLKSVQLRVIGSVLTGDLQNFRLFVDGVAVGSAVAQQDSGGYLVFDLSGSPLKLETGSRTLKVLVNIVGGSSKNFYLSLRQKSDLWAVDSQYNASVLPSGTFPANSTAQNIAAGTLTFTRKPDSPSGDVVKGASGTTLARFELKAAGEKMKVENLRVSNSSTYQLALRNGALFADGVQIGSTQTIWEDSSPTASNSVAYTEFNLGSSLIVTPGTPRILEIRSDIFDASGTNNTTADGTITANVEVGSSNVQRLTTLDYVNGPTVAQGIQSGNQLTVKTGAFTAGKYTGYANQTIVAPKTNYKLGHYTLAVTSSEDVNVNTLTFDAQAGYGGGGTLTNDFADAYVKVWNDAGSVVLTTPVKTTFSVTGSNSFSVNLLLPKNKTYQVELFANVNSSFASAVDSVRTNFDAAGVTTGSSTTVTADQVNGQTITAQAGSLTKANSSVPAATLAAGGTTKVAYAFTLQPQYDDFTLDEVYVDLSSTVASSTGAVANLVLKEGTTQIGSATVNSTTGSASFTGLNRSLMQTDGTKTYTVEAVLSAVGVGGNDTGGNVTVRLDGLKFRNSSGTVTTENGYVPASFTGNAIFSYKAFPSFANVALPTTVLANGTQTIGKFTLTGNGGEIAFKKLVFSVTDSVTNGAGGATTFSNFKLFENGSDISSLASHTYPVLNTASKSVWEFAVERPVSTATTYELRADVAGVDVSGESITVSIANPRGATTQVVSAPFADFDADVDSDSTSFIWSDKSAASHAATTTDWMTDFLLKEIAGSQTMTK